MTDPRVQPESTEPPFAGSKFRTSTETDFSKHLLQAKAAAERYIAAQFGRVQLLFRNLLFLTLFGIMVFLATATFAVVAVVQICYGIAGAIGALLGNRPWAGQLIVGVAILGGTCTFCWVAVSKIRKNARQKAMDDYIKSGALPLESRQP